MFGDPELGKKWNDWKKKLNEEVAKAWPYEIDREKILEKSKKPWENKYMTLNDYQEEANKTANFHGCLTHQDGYGLDIHISPKLEAIIYCSLGLAGESGEVVENTKKMFRKDKSKLTEKRKEKFLEEIGDVLWYIANLSTSIGFTLEEVAEYNLQKLKKRYAERENVKEESVEVSG